MVLFLRVSDSHRHMEKADHSMFKICHTCFAGITLLLWTDFVGKCCTVLSREATAKIQ